MKVLIDKLVDLCAPIPEGELVVDCGAYAGDYTAEVLKHSKCNAVLFEPNPQMAHKCRLRFNGNPDVVVEQATLGNREYKTKLYLNEYRSSLYQSWTKTDDCIEVPVKRLSLYLAGRIPHTVKINCEGCEHAIIEDLWASGILKDVKQILVQFHFINHLYKDNIGRTWKYLEESHECIYSFKWQIWKQRMVIAQPIGTMFGAVGGTLINAVI